MIIMLPRRRLMPLYACAAAAAAVDARHAAALICRRDGAAVAPPPLFADTAPRVLRCALCHAAMLMLLSLRRRIFAPLDAYYAAAALMLPRR